MKKIIYTAIILASGSCSFAQGFLDHGGFESWVTQNSVVEPQGWYTLNPLTMFGMPATTTQSSQAHGGSFAALLETKEGTFNDLPGLLTSANILTSSGNPDLNLARVPFAMRPKNFEFYYMYFPATGDSCSGVIVLTRWNAAQQRTDTVGVAAFVEGDTTDVYTKMTVEFEYNNPLMPDSAMLIISSSADGFNPTVGSKLYIDDFSIGFETGLGESSSTLKNVSAYPNPSNGSVMIQTEESRFSYRVSDIHGKQLLTGNAETAHHALDITGFTPGIYLLRVESVNGVALQRLIVQ